MKLLKKRFVSLLLVLVMLCGIVPPLHIGVFAVGVEIASRITMQYDDHYDITDKNVEIIDTNEHSILKLEGNYLVATGIGETKVKIDDQLYEVTVEKAKINLIVIMGQSNAGNHFNNATSDVTCPIGTAYLWGNGKGTAATEPVDYTQPSMGFHAPLLAELYAQSEAAGAPVKNVLIWQEGITSKNGQSIVKWAASATDTSGTDATVTMIQNCRNYYEKHSDKYEIVSNGVYWLQGESDTAMDPTLYIQRFMAMWERLENVGMNYLAFLRLRWGVNGNGIDHQDLHYSASLSAQIRMINDNSNFYMATDLTENWVGTETTVHTVDISNYITVMKAYGGNPTYTDVYGNNATYANGKLTTTMKSLYGSNNKCHYGKFGYGLIGADAAYNMYNALKTDNTTIVVTDTSGHANRKKLLRNGQKITIDIANTFDDLSFRPACGSAAGTLEFIIRSDEKDITNHDGLVITAGQKYGAIDISKLRNYDNVSIEIIYNTVGGKKHTVVCDIIKQFAEVKKDYIWDFNEDLYARDEDGNLLNSFLTKPLAGSYTVKNGYLTGNALMLQLEQIIELEADKNWFVEWKYGAFVNGAAGFLLCEKATNSIGNKAFYHTTSDKIMISEYTNKQGYHNYTSSTVEVKEYDCLRITNRYNPTNNKSILSLWKNGELVIEDFQKKGNINSDTDSLDMTCYPLNGNFEFEYLGHNNIAQWGMNCELDYLCVSFGEENEWCDTALDPIITKQPESVETAIGEKFSITVQAEGEDLTYQWYYKESYMKDFEVSSNKTPSYSYTMQEYRHNRQVYCVITDQYGNSIQTDTATITRPPQKLAIIEQPEDVQVEIGQKFAITVKAEGEGLTYQWYYKESYMKDFEVSSNKTPSYAYTMQEYRHNRQVYCVITDQYGNSIQTDTATITRPPQKLAIIEQPEDVHVEIGQKFAITVQAEGEGLTYQWYYKESYMKDFEISSNKTSSYAYTMQEYRHNRQVYCVITDQYGNSVQTNTVTMTHPPL